MTEASPHIREVECVLPAHYADQPSLTRAIRGMLGASGSSGGRLEQFHASSQVTGRHLALPLPRYVALDSFAESNRAWTEVALDLGEKALRGALARAGLAPADLDHLFFTTITGLATPSIDARLANRLGLRADLKRTPIFGLGCVGGAAGLARVADYLRAFPDHVAVLLAVELCSLTLQREDVSVANLVATSLFGDGAAAVVCTGANRGGGPRVLASRSVLYPDSEWVMGWDFRDRGFKIVLSDKVPAMVRRHLQGDVDGFLQEHGLTRSDISHWVFHTGGPRVLEAVQETLELPPDALARSWASLKSVGNLSSASVLFVLADALKNAGARPGEYGLVAAMGPGFCSELVLLRW